MKKALQRVIYVAGITVMVAIILLIVVCATGLLLALWNDFSDGLILIGSVGLVYTLMFIAIRAFIWAEEGLKK